MRYSKNNNSGWQFWVDRGGTFTDIIARSPDGELLTYKLLSESPRHYQDATLAGIYNLLKIQDKQQIPANLIESVSIGTTIATNALLERKGEPTVLVITKGFGDALRIGYQNRPELFAKEIVLPEPLYSHVIEVEERIDVTGNILTPINEKQLTVDLQRAYAMGFHSVAIVFLHAYRFPQHELIALEQAKKIGFQQISVSHEINPLIKLIGRGDTTVADCYISPKLKRYSELIRSKLGNAQVLFMQSNGGLIDSKIMHGKDCVLSGPAAGVVGAIEAAHAAGFDKIISFDMGGTSTDVAHYAGELERSVLTTVAGVHMRSPMVEVNTIAAGGGSVVRYDQSRYQVGPESAGAYPGPASYRQGGPLTITDCNILLGRIQTDYYPKVFGVHGDQPLSKRILFKKFRELADIIRQDANDNKCSIENIAAGFLKIAVNNMANAIKKITLQRGYDVTQYTLCSFGGAGAQHACAVADELGIGTIIIHPQASILSAYGLSVAKQRLLKEKGIEEVLTKESCLKLLPFFRELEKDGLHDLAKQHTTDQTPKIIYKTRLRQRGSDTSLEIPYAIFEAMQLDFNNKHQQLFGFTLSDTDIMIESISVEIISHSATATEDVSLESKRSSELKPTKFVKIFFSNRYLNIPLFEKKSLGIGDVIAGPAIIVEPYNTIIIEPDWCGEIIPSSQLQLKRTKPLPTRVKIGTKADPIMLEIFYHLFMNTAEQMGTVLAKTAFSINIKERLDFSCAVFDSQGDLVANAQHIPVHLGSMRDSVQAVIKRYGDKFQNGDAYVLNNPYYGGTHLPDVTVITPIFYEHNIKPLFFVASRAHQADIGGITPGSVPASSQHIEDEGILIDSFKLVDRGKLLEQEFISLLTNSRFPVRNVRQNIADIKAQIAANLKGAQELIRILNYYGSDTVSAYTGFLQENAELCVKEIIPTLKPGKFSYSMDNGIVIAVQISIDQKSQTVILDFSGSSKQQPNNFNAPKAVCYAAVLYVFRVLVKENIPLNQGCFKPLHIIIPDDCLLNPKCPAAVVAGNVETSQCIVDTLFGALQVMAASQGTMNNLTFGNDNYQYYETICGGSGAGPGFHGTSAVHTHMTNTLLTDPEILEQQYPVRLIEFCIRKNSGGAGKWHGGDGVIRKLQFLESMTVAIITNHRHVPPYGMDGGEAGKVGKNCLLRANGEIEALSSVAEVRVGPLDILVIETPGGGGYGKL